MIKIKKKEQQNYEKELTLLYKIAAIDSFLFATQYIQEIHLPAFNVVELIPKRVYESLKYDYQNLGYNSLPLLNQTDCKWLAELWGEPDKHTTLIALHQDVWDKYLKRLINKQWKEHNKFLKSLGLEPASIEDFLELQRKIDEKLRSDES